MLSEKKKRMFWAVIVFHYNTFGSARFYFSVALNRGIWDFNSNL